MNKELAKYVLNLQYHLKSIGVHKSRWKKMIVKVYHSSGTNKLFSDTAFRETWKDLYTLGLLERK